MSWLVSNQPEKVTCWLKIIFPITTHVGNQAVIQLFSPFSTKRFIPYAFQGIKEVRLSGFLNSVTGIS